MTTMKQAWNERAEENAMKYILETTNQVAFWDSGKAAAKELAELFGNVTYCEIGCGIGRIVVPLADKATKVYGYDISSAMINQARMFGTPTGKLQWIEGYGDGEELAKLQDVDIFYERLCFQHIPTEYLIKLLKNIRLGMRTNSLLLFKLNIVSEDDGRYWKKLENTNTWTSRGYTEEDINNILLENGLKQLLKLSSPDLTEFGQHRMIIRYGE